MLRAIVSVALVFATCAGGLLVLYGLQKAIGRRGYRPGATGVVVGLPDRVAVRIGDLATLQRGQQVAIDAAGTVTWRRGMSAAAFEHRFRAELRPAGTDSAGRALSEVRIEFRITYSLYDWGAGRRMARSLLTDLGREPIR